MIRDRHRRPSQQSNRYPYRLRISEGKRILLLRMHGSFPFVTDSTSSELRAFLGSWGGVNRPLEPLSNDADLSISGELPGQLPGGLIAIISSFQCEPEAPAMRLPKMQSAIVSALSDWHHEGMCKRRSRKSSSPRLLTLSRDAAKVRLKNRQYVLHGRWTP